jgi:hypothetical protein
MSAAAKELFTNSRGKDFRACPRLHHIRYNLGVGPVVEADVVRFGSLWHTGTEAWWKAIGDGLPNTAWLDHALNALCAAATDPLDLVRAEELMVGYHLRWWNEGYEPLAVEVEFRCDLKNPRTGASSRTFDLAGKIDGIIRDRAGRVLLTERKTSSEDIGVGSEYWRRLTLDPQVSTYFVGARSLGYDVTACLYDVVAKPRLQPFQATPLESRKYRKDGGLYAGQRETGETLDEYRDRLRGHIADNPDRYYQRGEVVRLADQEEEAAYDAWQTARLIREAASTGHHIRNPDACSRFGRVCPFFDVCTGLTTLENPAHFKRVEIHQELAEVTHQPESTKEECTP